MRLILLKPLPAMLESPSLSAALTLAFSRNIKDSFISLIISLSVKPCSPNTLLILFDVCSIPWPIACTKPLAVPLTPAVLMFKPISCILEITANGSVEVRIAVTPTSLTNCPFGPQSSKPSPVKLLYNPRISSASLAVKALGLP